MEGAVAEIDSYRLYPISSLICRFPNDVNESAFIQQRCCSAKLTSLDASKAFTSFSVCCGSVLSKTSIGLTVVGDGVMYRNVGTFPREIVCRWHCTMVGMNGQGDGQEGIASTPTPVFIEGLLMHTPPALVLSLVFG